MPTWLKNSLKVTAAGATIFLIASSILTMERPTQPEVREAEADIIALNFAEESKTQKFARSMVDLGMEEPRSYDWNGNKVFFTTATTQESPVQVLRRFQDKFVEEGINERRWTRSLPRAEMAARPDQWSRLSADKREAAAEQLKTRFDRMTDFFGGGVVPTQISDDYVSMVGMESRGEAEDGLEFLTEVLQNGGYKEASGQVKAMRWVEAMREGNRTRISAMWSDEELDMEKFEEPKHAANVSPSATIPVCMGCVRKTRFAAESGEKGYVSNVFHGQLTPPDAARFYRMAMHHRGWKLSDSTRLLDLAERRGVKPPSDHEFLSFARGSDFATVLIYRGREGKTIVQVLESP